MAVNPKPGPLLARINADPNGPPGTTSGGVQQVTMPRVVGDPTAGAASSIPPFNVNPSIDPTTEGTGSGPFPGLES